MSVLDISLMSGYQYCLMEPDVNRKPDNCSSIKALNDSFSNLENRMNCNLSNAIMKSAALYEIVALESCIDCYKINNGVDEFINDFKSRFDSFIAYFSISQGLSIELINDLIASKNLEYAIIHAKIESLVSVSDDEFIPEGEDFDYCNDSLKNSLKNLFE